MKMKKWYAINIILVYFLLSLSVIYAEDIDSRDKFISYMEREHGFNSKDLMLWGEMELILNKRKFKVPTVKELTSILDVELKLLEHFLYQASHMRYLVKINRNRYFFPSTIFDLAKIFREKY